MMQATIRQTQQQQQAGYTKLTAVTVQAHGRRRQFFMPLQHNAQGEAILPQSVLDQLLTAAGVRRGDTYSVS